MRAVITSKVKYMYTNYLQDELGRALDYDTMADFVGSPIYVDLTDPQAYIEDLFEHGAIVIPIKHIEDENKLKRHLDIVT